MDIACREVVELVTDYLEGVLPAPRREAVEEHLRECPACVEYVEQMRATIAAIGQVRTESLSPATRDGLVSAFRDLIGREGPRQ